MPSYHCKEHDLRFESTDPRNKWCPECIVQALHDSEFGAVHRDWEPKDFINSALRDMANDNVARSNQLGYERQQALEAEEYQEDD